MYKIFLTSLILFFSSCLLAQGVRADKTNISIGITSVESIPYIETEYTVKRFLSVYSRLGYSTSVVRYPLESVVSTLDDIGFDPEISIDLINLPSFFISDKVNRFLFSIGARGYYQMFDRHSVFLGFGLTINHNVESTLASSIMGLSPIGYRYSLGYRFDFYENFFARVSLKGIANFDSFIWEDTGVSELSVGYTF